MHAHVPYIITFLRYSIISQKFIQFFHSFIAPSSVRLTDSSFYTWARTRYRTYQEPVPTYLQYRTFSMISSAHHLFWRLKCRYWSESGGMQISNSKTWYRYFPYMPFSIPTIPSILHNSTYFDHCFSLTLSLVSSIGHHQFIIIHSHSKSSLE